MKKRISKDKIKKAGFVAEKPKFRKIQKKGRHKKDKKQEKK